MTESQPRRRLPARTRAVGLLGGLLAALAGAALAYETIAWVATTREWVGSDRVTVRLVGLLGLFTLGAAAIAVLLAAVLLALGVTAMLDAARSGRGGPAGRLWQLFALPASIGLATMMAGPTAGEVQVWLVIVAVTATNYAAWRAFRLPPAGE